MAEVKICGVITPEILQAAAVAGARYIGLVFARKSPRFIDTEHAVLLTRHAPTGVKIVGLFVDPSDDDLAAHIAHVPIDMIQLHGDESPARVASVKSRYKLPVMKAIPLATAMDLQNISLYEPVCDWLLFDAKAPAQGGINGGHGIAFDWSLLVGKTFQKPWMLAGGLTSQNVGEALERLHPDAVDVSSGVESAKGIKDPEKIRSFMMSVRSKG